MNPIVRLGGSYDGIGPEGWYVLMPDAEGELIALSGPHEACWDACVAYARLRLRTP